MAKASKAKNTYPGSTTWDRVKPAPIVLILGTEGLFQDRAWERVRDQVRKSASSIEIETVDGTTYTAGQLHTLASPSLFAEPKLIKIENAGVADHSLFKDLEQYLHNPAEDVTIAIIVGSGQRGKNTWKLIGNAKFPVVHCDAVKSDEARMNLVVADLKRHKRSIAPAAAAALVRALGEDLRGLAAATDQLLSDTTGEITEAVVKQYYQGRVETTGFDVADAVVAGQMGKALVSLRHAQESGINPVVIVAALATKFRQIALAKLVDANTHSAQELGFNPWALKFIRPQLRYWNDHALAGAILAVAQADAEVKGAAKDPMHAVEKCVISCCRYRAGSL
ncbi:DNA polymerase III subunit delta [Boudabousia marimammalium]|uniref:DNA polymerase III subunit delta n=1 Tax=Boudabousia marimammalium TaxID=156892 RepID=A0A1Q5PP90_9ACTO|nr:DNA polymerase III subunit delta [Boudabousia marimammalium]OKL49332.1 DNA polymerase III subunit delta [Boudabousia marimammalium]